MKQITKDQYNALSEDIISSLNSGSLMTLRVMGYINAGDVINTLLEQSDTKVMEKITNG